jgi:hypothetical protein
MTRQQYTTRDLGSFSEWHRSELCDWYTWIDIDYLGYQRVSGELKPYIAVERIRLTSDDPRDGPSKYPLDGHKQSVYEQVATELDIPAFSMWHTDDCEVFTVKRIDGEEQTRVIHGKRELMDLFDTVAANVFGGLGHR